MTNTIFALSTVFGRAGVAVVRVCGSQALSALAMLGYAAVLEPRKAVAAKLWTVDHSNIIDQCILLYFKAPHSFNGDDIVEIHTHGSIAVINDLLDELSKIPFLRLAEPGEFTKIAFYNGKMDLTQAEALADLLDAETSIQRQVAVRQLSGELESLYTMWRKQIINSIAQVEALIDFPDEDIPQDVLKTTKSDVKNLITTMEQHVSRGKQNEAIMSGISVVIAGPPNAGKSSIMNLIAKKEVAIVSHLAGTTRDVVQIKINLHGFAVILSDTAGIRETEDIIEKEGIIRAKSAIESADILIIVLDATESIKYEDYLQLLAKTRSSIPILFLFNKCDIIDTAVIAQYRDEFQSNNDVVLWHYLITSTKTGDGISLLLDMLSAIIKEQYEYAMTEPTITRLRQQNRLIECISYLKDFTFAKPMEMAAQDLLCASNCLGAITGYIHTEEILDVIFQTFCIGK